MNGLNVDRSSIMYPTANRHCHTTAALPMKGSTLVDLPSRITVPPTPHPQTTGRTTRRVRTIPALRESLLRGRWSTSPRPLLKGRRLWSVNGGLWRKEVGKEDCSVHNFNPYLVFLSFFWFLLCYFFLDLSLVSPWFCVSLNCSWLIWFCFLLNNILFLHLQIRKWVQKRKAGRQRSEDREDGTYGRTPSGLLASQSPSHAHGEEAHAENEICRWSSTQGQKWEHHWYVPILSNCMTLFFY